MIDPRNSKFSPKIKIDKYQVSSRLRPYDSLESIRSAYSNQFDYILPGSTPAIANAAPVLYLSLVFDSVASANTLVGDASNISDWNTFFNLPVNGNPFTSVTINGNEIQLFGGSNITIADNNISGAQLISIVDSLNCIVAIYNDSSFDSCEILTTVELPACETITGPGFSWGQFSYCTSLSTITLPSVTSLGNTVGDNSVFFDDNTLGKNITLTVPSALMTCNSGNPDGDIQWLQANNTVTVVTV